MFSPDKMLPNPSFGSFASLTGAGRLRRPVSQLKRQGPMPNATAISQN